MALFDPKDLFKPLGGVAVLAGAAALGFVAGYAIGRNPDAAKKVMQFVASGFDRLSLAVAETREELGDYWAEARAEARAEVEEAQFAAAAAAAAVEPVAAAPAAADPADEVLPTKPAARRARKAPPARRARRAKPEVVH
jgi:hypothetical protein